MHVHQLTYHYPKATRPVLDGVSFTLQPNKLNVLIGQNGAGKTTLFDCMTGTLSVDHASLSLVPSTDMLYLTQNILYYNELTGKDLTYFIGRLSKRPDFKKLESYVNGLSTAREQELFEHLWKMKLGKMSVGERKWLFVTLLASVKRSLYLFDEPTSGVDPASRIHIMRRLHRLVQDGRTCLISTHQLHDLSQFDAHVIFLHAGRVLYEGDFQDWLRASGTTDPDEAFVTMVEGTMNDVAVTR
ncbi:ABC transporter ATP-binding protein [Exiguobacterium sp. SL-9]|uniref:AAA family ATPase n=1 Tax=Exiguobacterium sp. SL-9 TaxID=2510963 RepID=UPI00103E1AED|nr:ABC transporter ATP-binding protein [Exiguobacterium sp. SL-9]TCI20556.1 ABC transporter ATP-binding protein [Exiguobacterium sp. SL-9]